MRPTIEEIKRRHLLEEVVTLHGVHLSVSGQYLRGHCPFHDDRTPSFVIDPETGRWRCFGRCDAQGSGWMDAIDFVGWRIFGSRWNSRNKAMFKQALRRLESAAGATRTPFARASRNKRRARLRHVEELPFDAGMLLDRVAVIYQARLWAIGVGPDTPLEYLHERSYDDETLRRAVIGYCAGDQLLKYLRQTGVPVELAQALNLIDEDCQREFLRGRIVFPDLDRDGHVKHMVGRKWAPSLHAKAPKYLSMKGVSKPLFGWKRLQQGPSDGRPVFLTESLTDWLTLLQWGYDGLATLGTALREEHAGLLRQLQRPLVCLPHNDGGAGMEAVQQWQATIGNGVIMELPTAVKDVNDLARIPGGCQLFEHLIAQLQRR